MPSKRNSDAKTGDRDAPDEGMSGLALLERDHREVETYFEEYEKASGQTDKEALALKICLALELHTRIEEEVFYPAAREALKENELIDEAIVEHAAAKQLITEIEGMEDGDRLRDAKVKVLGEQVQHHVQEEEQELFPKLQQGKLDLETLGRQMVQRKEELLSEVAEGREEL